MNARTARIYNFIADFVEREGYSPTQREIAEGLGIPAVSNVFYHVSTLQGMGLITQKLKRFRTIRPTDPAFRMEAP